MNNKMQLDKKKVVLGMSGGVDSTVAAQVLKDQGYEVIGITMKVWEEDADSYAEDYGGCCSLSAVEDARRVADSLDIPFYVVNYKQKFFDKVIDNFIDEYIEGKTPNPCIRCNKYVKFDELLKTAHSLGAYYVATGHYAKISHNEETDRYLIEESSESKKDQTYMLYNLSQDQIKHILMPLGDFETKAEVRKIAETLDLNIARKSDSQEICFVIDDNYTRFVKEHTDKKLPIGNFIDTEGNILGKHKGIIYYTIGQRKHLGMSFGKPMFVLEIKADTNEVVLGDNVDLFKTVLYAKDINFIPFDKIEEPLECMGKARYSSPKSPCIVEMVGDDKIKVTFETPQRAITPGQAVVFYKDGLLIGGGTICSL